MVLNLSDEAAIAAYLFITNYRVRSRQIVFKPEDRNVFSIYLLRSDSFEVPLLALSKCERVITREKCDVELQVKDGRTLKFSHSSSLPLRQSLFDCIYEGAFSSDIRRRFAFSHFVVAEENGWQIYNLFDDFAHFGVTRDTDSNWFFLNNSNGEICDTYPDFIVTPRMSSHELLVSSQFRARNRMPSMVWRHADNTATLWRAAQFKVASR